MTVHIFTNTYGDGEYFEAWTDCEPGHHHTGRCLASGESLEAVRAEAAAELQRDLADLPTVEPITAEEV